jgi:hypothetical protein
VPDDKAGALEKHQLPTEVRDSLDELRALSSKAEDGDKDAKKELRRKLREASPQVVARASDISRTAQHMLIRTAAAKDPLTQGALSGRLDMMREEIAGENPTPLEVLLTERVVSCWMVVTLFEVLMAGQLNADAKSRTPLSYTLKMLKWQESAHRQYLAAIRELARVRKLEASLPTVQVNNQVNILQG